MVVSSNVTNVEFHISEYQKIIAGLRAEVFDLKTRITNDDHEEVQETERVMRKSVHITQQVGAPCEDGPLSAEDEERAAMIRKEAAEAFELGACTIRTKEALVALEDGMSLSAEGNKRVLDRWRLERQNSDLELAEMQALKRQITASFQERIQTRRMLFEIEDKNMQNKADIEWRLNQIEAYENCRTDPRPSSVGAPATADGQPKEEPFVMSSPKEEPASIRNLRREVDVYSSNSDENVALKSSLEKRLCELSEEGKRLWSNLGSRVTRIERRELLELVVQTHTLELENMELELQLRLKDKMIADLQKEMEEMRMTMRRHGIDADSVCDEHESALNSDRSHTVDDEHSTSEMVSEQQPIQEEIPFVM